MVLVDEADVEIGCADKLEAHRSPGLRHRAFSVLVFDAAGRLLLQRRAAEKYHFAGRWSNTCCGHPRPGETRQAAAVRRVHEELGLSVALQAGPSFEYRAQDPHSGLVEHEIDQLFWCNAAPSPFLADPSEVAETSWVDRAELAAWMQRDPGAFTPWLPPLLGHAEALWP